MNRLLFSVSLLLLTSSYAVSQKSKAEQAHKVVASFVENQDIPGLAATVYHNGEIVWSEGFGYSDLEHSVLVDPAKTKFRIGSISKTLTASALGRLLDTKSIDLDAPIQKYVSAFPEKKYPISIRQLGGHTAGIRHYKGGEFMSTKHYSTVLEGLSIFDKDPLLFEPSTQYKYSSYGWNLLSAAIESLAEVSFLKYMDIEVFQALGMDNTLAEYHDDIIPHRTSYYVKGKNEPKNAPFVDNSYKWAGGGFLSTPHDLVKFGKAHMQTDYLSQKTLDVLLQPQVLKDGTSTKYGIGWRTYTDSTGMQWVGHSGGSVGGTSIFVMNAAQDIIVIMTGNSSSIKYDGIHFVLGHIFLEE